MDAQDASVSSLQTPMDAFFSRYAASLSKGALLLLPALAKGEWASAGLSFNELQLRAITKARCFMTPQGGASYLSFYQPGFHVVNDRTGKERCVSSLQAKRKRKAWAEFGL